jgi:hypothetical protein
VSGQLSIEMEEVHIASESEDEREGRDVNLGVEGSNSNGHERGLYKEGHLMKLIEKLQKDAQAHRANSRKLMRVRDQQGEFNFKMLKSLEIIERKLEKGSDSSKTESRRTPERKRRSRNARTPERRRRSRGGSRHHRRSPKHSSREAHSGSSPSHTRKNKRSRMDELKGDMNKIKPPTFDGEHKKEEDVETWLLGMRKYFQLQNYCSHAKGIIAMYQLKGKASMWWDHFVQVQHIREKDITWKEFKRYFEKQYLTKRYYDRKMKEFFELKLGSMTIDEYE